MHLMILGLVGGLMLVYASIWGGWVFDFEFGLRDLHFSPGITNNLGESLLFLVAL